MTKKTQDKSGFSLTEVLLAVGILAVGMLFIAGVFPVSIHFTTVASERTIAATVADEAFAKIKLYGISDVNWIIGGQTPYEFVAAVGPPSYEFGYPSTTTDLSQKYWWSAICRRIPGSLNDVQVTVFICRKAGTETKYYTRSVLPPFDLSLVDRPVPVFVSVSQIIGRTNELLINETPNFINDGYTIVDDETGNIYRVLERYSSTPNVVRLDKDWQGSIPQKVWTVPASATVPIPATIGRYPCIAVFQKVMRF